MASGSGALPVFILCNVLPILAAHARFTSVCYRAEIPLQKGFSRRDVLPSLQGCPSRGCTRWACQVRPSLASLQQDHVHVPQQTPTEV